MRSLTCAALLAAAPVCSLAFSRTLSAQDVAGPGFALAPAPFPGAPAFGATTTLTTGEFLVFDGLDLFHYASGGAPIAHLGGLDAWAFPSLVLATPDEREIYFGESNTGKIYRVALEDPDLPVLVATLPFHYDAAFSDGRELYVSAATCGIGCGNEIWGIDVLSLAPRLIARVPGASGPIVCDDLGGLWYATVSAFFPPPPKPTRIYRWSAAELTGPEELSLADAQFIGGGFEGAARLAFDARIDALYLVENNFTSGANRIRRVLGAPDQSPVVVEGQLFRSIGNLSLLPGTGPAQLRAYQPASDAALTYTTTDFVAPPERIVAQPRRASASFSGPGTSGPGPFVLSLRDGPPHGFARLLLSAAGDFRSPERVFPVAGLPLFLGLGRPLDLATPAGPKLLELDADGSLEQSYTNPGGLAGHWAAQFVLYDASGRLVGSASPAFL